MATPMAGPFDVWLTEKLTSLSSDVDTDVFVSYITGILDTDSSDEENEESITELLAGVVEMGVASQVCKEIILQWKAGHASDKNSQAKEDMGDKLSMMFEKQILPTVKEKKLTKEEADRKAAILAQYAQVSDGEEDDEEDEADEVIAPPSGGGGGTGKAKGDTSDPLLVRNVNKEDVQRVEREKREKAKEENEKKKEKDKQDRQAQKQKQQERKEAEKKRTQKGEKRR